MPTVTYQKNVSDNNVKTVLQRIADSFGANITVHSGDRNFVPGGGSKTSLHLQNRAADFHIQGYTDAQGFDAIKAKFDQIFDASEAYEFIRHGTHTATGGPHLHIGRYGNGRKGYVKFKTEGLSAATKGNYNDVGTETKNFTNSKSAPITPTVVSGVGVDISVHSPTLGVSQSVGVGGNNKYSDVKLVQTLLNLARARMKEAQIAFENFQVLVEDGDCGRFTKRAITIFQRDVLGFSEPDGRIDPGGKTIRSLYVAAYGDPKKISPRVKRVTSMPIVTPSGNTDWNGVLAWGTHPNVSTPFRDKTIQICNELQIKNPSWLMTVMAFETGRTFAPDTKNGAGSSGTGLIQFMRATIDGETRGGKFYPGLGQKLGITHAQLAGMSAVRQLDVVKAYFQQFGNKAAQSKDVDDLYFLVLLPSAYGKADSATMFQSGTKAYTQNKGLDTDRDGRVTVEETARKIRAMLREGLDKHPYQYR